MLLLKERLRFGCKIGKFRFEVYVQNPVSGSAVSKYSWVCSSDSGSMQRV